MEKLVKMIQTFAEQAAVPAKVAAERIVLAHGYTCWGNSIAQLIGGFFAITAIFMGVKFLITAKIICKESEQRWRDDHEVPYYIGGLVLCVVGGFLFLFTWVDLLVDMGGTFACIYEPAGHLMKTFLVK